MCAGAKKATLDSLDPSSDMWFGPPDMSAGNRICVFYNRHVLNRQAFSPASRNGIFFMFVLESVLDLQLSKGMYNSREIFT